jgi:chorismate mutase
MTVPRTRTRTMTMMVRSLRGATSVTANTEPAILAATAEMVSAALAANSIQPDDIVSIIFTVTPDLDAAFPARAARELGLTAAPLLDMVSPSVPGALKGVVRMLLTWQTPAEQSPPMPIQHVYLGQTRQLRPDWSSAGESTASAATLTKDGEPE